MRNAASRYSMYRRMVFFATPDLMERSWSFPEDISRIRSPDGAGVLAIEQRVAPGLVRVIGLTLIGPHPER